MIYEDTLAPKGILPAFTALDILKALINRTMINIIKKQLVFFTFMPLNRGRKMTSLIFFEVREIFPFQSERVRFLLQHNP